MHHLGILLYGPLALEPGAELAAATHHRIAVRTPFPVEFAHACATRDEAPVLTVVEHGLHVPAVILVLHEHVTLAAAQDMLLWRARHASAECEAATRLATPHDYSDDYPTFLQNLIAPPGGVEYVIHLAPPPNIPHPTATTLAQLAVRSATLPMQQSQRDGISYLLQARAAGVTTHLSTAYEAEILRLTGSATLTEALDAAALALTSDGSIDPFDCALDHLRRRYDVVTRRTQYLDARAATFLTILGITGAVLTAFLTFALGKDTIPILVLLRANPIVVALYAALLICYFAAAIATALVNYPWWTAIPMLDNPPLNQLMTRPDVLAPNQRPLDAQTLKRQLVEYYDLSVRSINFHLNKRKHLALAVAGGFIAAALVLGGILSFVVFTTINVPPATPTAASTRTPTPSP